MLYRRGAGIVPAVVVPNVEGMHHPVVGAYIGGLTAIGPPLEILAIPGVAVEDIEAFTRRANDRRTRIDDVAQSPDFQLIVDGQLPIAPIGRLAAPQKVHE